MFPLDVSVLAGADRGGARGPRGNLTARGARVVCIQVVSLPLRCFFSGTRTAVVAVVLARDVPSLYISHLTQDFSPRVANWCVPPRNFDFNASPRPTPSAVQLCCTPVPAAWRASVT